MLMNLVGGLRVIGLRIDVLERVIGEVRGRTLE